MTSMDLPEDLLADVLRIAGAKTKREAVTTALEDFVRRDAQRQAIAALTQMDFTTDLLDPDVRARARR